MTPAFPLVHLPSSFFYIPCLLGFHSLKWMFHRASHPRSIQASRPYFAFSPCIGLVYHLPFYIPLKRPKLGGLSSSYISHFTPSLAPLIHLRIFSSSHMDTTRIKRVQLAYHQGTILNSPKLFCKLCESNGKDLYRRHVYDTSREYYPHDIEYSDKFFTLSYSLWRRGTLGYSLIVEIHPQLLASLLWGRLL